MRNDENQKRLKREWYHRNREAVLAQQAEKRIELREWFQQYKSTLSCAKCGFSHPAAIDFHHEDGSEKEFLVSALIGRNHSKNQILKEIAKCTPFCSNCHRIFHYDERNQKRAISLMDKAVATP